MPVKDYFGIRKGQMTILVTNLLILAVFSVIFINRANYEFLAYIGVTLFFMILIAFTNKKVYYPNFLLWSLTLWSFSHMCGGGIFLGGVKLYDTMILELVGEPYLIFKYDQLVHIIGFGASTLAMYTVLRPDLRQGHGWWGLSIVVVMAGLGVGALNEIVEFITSIIVEDTGVGGYINTSLDLVADLIGAVFAALIIFLRESKKAGIS